MSSNVLSLTTCPFCENECGEISINATKVASWRSAFPVGGKTLLSDEPDQRIFIFNSDDGNPGPCRHALQMNGAIRQDPKKSENRASCTWCLDFDWLHSALDDSNAGRTLCSYLWDVAVDRRGPRKFLPKTALVEGAFRRRWRDANSDVDGSSYYHIDGSMVFVEDTARFVAEVPKLAAERWAWVERYLPAGIDCLNLSFELVETQQASQRTQTQRSSGRFRPEM